MIASFQIPSNPYSSSIPKSSGHSYHPKINNKVSINAVYIQIGYWMVRALK
jgi:hypothetical protein